jgi:arsenate reductase
VIAVCDPDAAERCPIFPAEKQRLHWPFPDPSRISGTMEEQVEGIRPIRDEIYEKVTDFLRDIDVK